MKKHSFTLSVTLPASPDVVFAALVDAKHILRWCGQEGRVSSSVGGKFDMFDGWVKGIVLAYEPGKRLSYTWLPGEWPENAEASLVTYRFTKAGSNTRVSLRHSKLPNAHEAKNHKRGWKEFVFDPLKEYLLSITRRCR